MKQRLAILVALAITAQQPMPITQEIAATVSFAIPGLQATTPPPQVGQRGPATTPSATQTAPLDAEHCRCSIEVTVKRSGTGEPIGEVEVTLNRSAVATTLAITKATTAAALAGRGLNVPQGMIDALLSPSSRALGAIASKTDSNGHAVFHDLAEGTYSIEAKRKGYFGVSNDTYPTQATSVVAVGPIDQSGTRGMVRKPVQQVTLDMIQGLTISGRLLDANQRPAIDIQIGVFQSAYQDGHRVLTQTGDTVHADDRGEFRLFWFAPGEYYIRAGGSGVATALRATTGSGGTSYPATFYYPGTTDPKLAVPVVIREGNDLTGIDIALQASTGVTVSGTITNTIPSGRIDPQGQVDRSISSIFLVPRNPYFSETISLLSNIGGAAARAATNKNPQNDSESTFEIRSVPPGSYDFYSVFNDGTAARTDGLEKGYYSARTPIEVRTENITGIQTVIRPGADLLGQVTITGNPPASQAGRAAQTLTLSSVRIQIQPKDDVPSQVVRGMKTTNTVDVNGRFTMANMIDVRYFISGISPLPADAYISEIRQDGRSVFDENVISIAKEPSKLEVVVSRGGPTIQGIVQDAKHNPVAAARITLIPDLPRRQNGLLYKSATSNAMGNFNLNGIAPGSYKLFAWEHIPAGAEQNAEFMREYDALGVNVNVVQGLPLANIQVPLIPARR